MYSILFPFSMFYFSEIMYTEKGPKPYSVKNDRTYMYLTSLYKYISFF